MAFLVEDLPDMGAPVAVEKQGSGIALKANGDLSRMRSQYSGIKIFAQQRNRRK